MARPAPTWRPRSALGSPARRSRSRWAGRSATSPGRSSDGDEVAIVTNRDDDSLDLIRHDTAHVLAAAVLDLYPGTKISIGPPIEDGFYYDFEFPEGVTVSDADFEQLEAKMREHVKAGEVFVREDVTPDAALERFKGEGQDYKVELIEDLVSNNGVDSVSLYTNGPFTDLCRGPHAPSTDRIKAFKLLSVAGAYWRGDSDNTMLTRIYGTAFHSKDDLAAHLERLEQARQRDHRKLGRELGLFDFSELSPGSAFWQPAGTAVYNALVARSRKMSVERGYEEIKTPLLYDRKLWEISGHWDKYRENMFVTESEDRPMALKPMNCPGHCAFYAMGKHSYRELPIRYAEPGHLHRNEPSGTLHGLLRVRHFIQDDAHIFCMDDQVEQEVLDCLAFGFAWYDQFGFDMRIELSTRPEQRIGTDEMWDRSEAALQAALDRGGYEYDDPRGRRRVLRAEDRPPHARLAEPLMAARHRPARLQLPRALRPHLHRRRQRRAPAGDAPPGAGGLVRALHRDPARAHRRRAAAVARADAGHGAPAGRPPQRLRAARWPRRCAPPSCARTSTTAPSRSGARSARPSCARCPTCSWSAIASRRSARSPLRRHGEGDQGTLAARRGRAADRRARPAAEPPRARARRCLLALAAPRRSASTAKIVIGDSCGSDLGVLEVRRRRARLRRHLRRRAGRGEPADRRARRPRDHALRPGGGDQPEAPCVALDAHTASCDGGKPTPEGADSVVGAARRRRRHADGRAGLGRARPGCGASDGDDMLTGGAEDDIARRRARAPTGSTAGRAGRSLSFAGRAAGVTVDRRRRPHQRRRRRSRASRPSSAATAPTACSAAPAADVLLGGRGADTLRGARRRRHALRRARRGPARRRCGRGLPRRRPAAGRRLLHADHPAAAATFSGAGRATTSSRTAAEPTCSSGRRRRWTAADAAASGEDGAIGCPAAPGPIACRGGAGRDRLFGGAGRTGSALATAGADRVACGAGRDTATRRCERPRARLRNPASPWLYFVGLIKRSHTAAPRTA